MRERNKTPFKVIRYARVDSTSRIAYTLGEQGADHGTVVLAEEQSGGRGRLSRSFASPRGGLYISVILRPRMPVDRLPLITLAAGVAAAEAVEKVSRVAVQLKWPNDLYGNGLKLGGILTESSAYSQVDRTFPFVVVGIGLNVNTPSESFPDSLQDLATSLYCLTGQIIAINSLLNFLVPALFEKVTMLDATPEGVLADWCERDFLLGKEICWKDPQGWIVRGSGNGLLPDGRYRLTTSRGDDYPVLAGDIVITEVNGKHIK